ncbi:MAG: DNA cytosine methyltransferase [Pseudomonadales bacterium]|nr:DNA cytosine methyltransferase [Pseudomonadales bacterium]
MDNGIKVVSLFDGKACGLQALKEQGIRVAEYHAFENDKYAMQIANKNHPEIIQHGEVTFMTDFSQFKDVDLLLAGSPCQGFSYAGKQLAFNDPRSQLFFEFVRAKKDIKPKSFLLENVKMQQKFTDTITNYVGVPPILINSALVSAQNRVRNYWCNWKVEQPEDKGIYLKNILQSDNEADFSFLSKKALEYMNKEVRGGRNHWDFMHHSDSAKEKSSTVVSNFFKGAPYNVLIHQGKIRRFTPVECERLQGLPDNYTGGVSNTQRYKMLGNGWNVPTIKHIFSQNKYLMEYAK